MATPSKRIEFTADDAFQKAQECAKNAELFAHSSGPTMASLAVYYLRLAEFLMEHPVYVKH